MGSRPSLSPSPSARNAKPERQPPAPFAGLPVSFIGSFPDPGQPLEPSLGEIALVGRSNVGKSSLINALLGRRRLARVSATPGKTQFLNVYRLPTFYLVDLPGYGWARASAASRKTFRQLLERYLVNRASLLGVVWLLDIRHAPSEEDAAVQELLARTGRPCLTVLTKSDKLGRMRRKEAARRRADELGLTQDDLLVTSTRSGEGISDLGDSIVAAVDSATA